eukprot:4404718-Amphidinium_carterae.1
MAEVEAARSREQELKGSLRIVQACTMAMQIHTCLTLADVSENRVKMPSFSCSVLASLPGWTHPKWHAATFHVL